MKDPYVGTLTFLRVYSGRLSVGDAVLNPANGTHETIGQMMLMYANQTEDLTEAFAGDIVAVTGLKATRTGDTLCAEAAPIVLERMEFPIPVMEVTLEPRTTADGEKMVACAGRADR